MDARFTLTQTISKSEHAEISLGDVSALAFDSSGDMLACGDTGGSITVMKRDKAPGMPQYSYYTSFTSHSTEFDYLKSVEIEPRLNKIRWLPISSVRSHSLLSTNDKTIKMWKITDRATNTLRASSRPSAKPHSVYANGHAYHVNSIAVNSDQETFLSSDDLRINLWQIGNPKESFMVVDMKPANMEELSEVITAADLHPQHCNILMYSSSKGLIRLGDMRQAALCDRSSKVFEDRDTADSKSFFGELVSSISDVKFSRDGRYILSRDFLSLKLWDINMEKRPIIRLPIHNHLRSKLCDLYESDCIFDKFDCSISPDSQCMVGGTYNNVLSVFDIAGNSSHYDGTKPKKESGGFLSSLSWGKKRSKSSIQLDPDNIDFSKKALRSAWHPHEGTLAVGLGRSVVLYSADLKE